MIHPTRILLTAALSLIMSASGFSGPAAPIPITSFPFYISGPGTYVLLTDLVCSAKYAITINNVAPFGDVVVDMRGHSITGVPFTEAGRAFDIQLSGPKGGVTIKNGCINNFIQGLTTEASPAGLAENITLDHLVFQNIEATAVFLRQTRGAIVNNCSFIGAMTYGIIDQDSSGGNQYTNNIFDGKQTIMITLESVYPSVLQRAVVVPKN